jgi:hypothetical protein
MVILRHRLPGGWLRSIQDRFEGPQIAKTHDLPEGLFSFTGEQRLEYNLFLANS